MLKYHHITVDERLPQRTCPDDDGYGIVVAYPSPRLPSRGACVLLRSVPILAIYLLFTTGTAADTPTASGTAALAEKAARRFPQPVRVGDLIGRRVLEPVPAQNVLGWVTAIVRNPHGGIDVVIRFGGLLGFGSRPIAVPVEAVALLGEHLAVIDFPPDQLRKFPPANVASATIIAHGESIRVGLTKPFH